MKSRLPPPRWLNMARLLCALGAAVFIFSWVSLLPGQPNPAGAPPAPAGVEDTPTGEVAAPANPASGLPQNVDALENAPGTEPSGSTEDRSHAGGAGAQPGRSLRGVLNRFLQDSSGAPTAGNGAQAAGGGASLRDKLARRGTVMFNDVPLGEGLLKLAEQWDVNISFGKELDGKANGSFKNTPLSEVLDALLAVNKLAYRDSGQSLIVMDLDNISGRHPGHKMATIVLPNSVQGQGQAQAQGQGGAQGQGEGGSVVEIAKLLKSGQGKVMMVGAALVVIDFPENIASIRNMVSTLSAGSNTRSAWNTETIANRASQNFACST